MWAVNGTMSVVASVLATLIAMAIGFSAVLWMGTACYTGAWIMAERLRVQGSQPLLP
jgi:hypothetical protein